MKLLRGSFFPLNMVNGTVATIGNFDGVHLGHQALLQKLRAVAKRLNIPSVLLVFEPQPGEFFLKDKAPSRLTNLREKLEVLKHCDIDYIYCLKFNAALASMSASDFAERYFFTLWKTSYLLVGEDFRFGKNREGDISLLKSLATKADCQVETFPTFDIGNERVSSTKIRSALARGDFIEASKFLGRNFSLCGRVAYGAGRGKQWGIPTANLTMQRYALPLKGVFCVRIFHNGQWYNGIANLGCRPTVDGTKNILEVHLFNFNGNLYGEMLKVFFIHKLRDEIKFNSVEALIDQIHQDIKMASLKFETDFISMP